MHKTTPKYADGGGMSEADSGKAKHPRRDVSDFDEVQGRVDPDELEAFERETQRVLSSSNSHQAISTTTRSLLTSRAKLPKSMDILSARKVNAFILALKEGRIEDAASICPVIRERIPLELRRSVENAFRNAMLAALHNGKFEDAKRIKALGSGYDLSTQIEQAYFKAYARKPFDARRIQEIFPKVITDEVVAYLKRSK